MQSLEGLPEKEKKRRLKISKKMKKIAARKRQAGLRAYWSAYRKEKAKREKAEKRAKEKEKERLRKEREKQKHKKKRGRKKKRGPKISQYQYRKRLKEKREKANRVRPTLPPPTFEIIWCRNKKREKSMGV